MLLVMSKLKRKTASIAKSSNSIMYLRDVFIVISGGDYE
jgi:hypothetical protein